MADLWRRWGVVGRVEREGNAGDALAGQWPVVSGAGGVAGDRALDLADAGAQTAGREQVGQDRSADVADQIGVPRGRDDAAAGGQEVPGGLQGGGEACPV